MSAMSTPQVNAQGDPQLPAKIGPYEVVGVLGRGASATIYLGRELFPAREVAIKVYDPKGLSAEDLKLFHSLFLKETLLARRLKHANITQIYDAAADDKRAWIVMEYCKGGNMDAFCTPDTLLHPRRVAHLLASCCEALSYAHAQGVVHRDLKPANLLLATEGGEAKVADFGVAFSNLAFDSTRSMVVGSPVYMAPEQIQGKPASMQSDIYSMGIVLYKMLVGALPFSADSPAMLATKIVLGNPPAPSLARPDLDPMFDVIFSRATNKDPQLRYPSWEDFAADLARLAGAGEDDAGDRPALMRPLAFFKELTDESIRELAPMARWFDVRAGSQLVGEDDPGYSFFVLVRGQMRVTRRGTLLGIRGAGEVLAETGFLLKSGQRRFSTLTAVTDCSVIEFDPDVLWLASPETTRTLQRAFLATMAERLVHAEGALAEMLGARNVTLF